MTIKDLIEFLNQYGFHIDVNASDSLLFVFALCILVLAIIALLSIINILIYLGILYIIENKSLLNRFSKYPFLVKLINIYKQTRLFYLIFEIVLLLASFLVIIRLCVRIVSSKWINLFSWLILKVSIFFKSNGYAATQLRSQYCFLLPLLLKSLGKDIPVDAEPIVNFSFNILVLALVVLACFINITGYFLSLYLIEKYNIKIKYPKYTKIVSYFEKSSLLFILIEIGLALFSLLGIILLNLVVLGLLTSIF